MSWVRRVAAAAVAGALVAMTPLSANAAVHLQGSFDSRLLKPTATPCPPSTNGSQCGVMQLEGLGPADFSYLFGTKFDPTGELGCWNVDGTFTVTLESDGSSLSGPLTGVLCLPGRSTLAPGSLKSYGNPYRESDTITFTSGTGQFSGLAGVGAYQQSGAGAVYRGTLSADLAG